MDLYPRLASWIGVFPVAIIAAALTVFQADPVAVKMYTVFLLCYSCLIITFLSGSHWQPALADRDNKRITLALLPALFCAGLLFWGFTRDPNLPLIGVIVLFWAAFFMDKKYYDMRHLPEDYMLFRFKMTTIVTALILYGYLVVT